MNRRIINQYVGAGILIFTSVTAQAADYIYPGETYENYDFVQVSDYVFNDGTLLNYGDYQFASGAFLYAGAQGTTSNYGGFEFGSGSFVLNLGQFNNDSSLILDAGALLYNTGTFEVNGSISRGFEQGLSTISNFGDLQNNAVINAGDLDNANQLINSGGLDLDGIMSNDINGSITNEAGGSIRVNTELNNYGTITNRGGMELTNWQYTQTRFNNGGQFVQDGRLTIDAGVISNTAGGTFNNTLYGAVTLGGEINNQGTFENEGSIDILNSNSPTGLINGGTFNNKARMWVDSGDITNSGTLNNDGDILVIGGELSNSGTLNNNGFLTGVEVVTNWDGVILNNGLLEARAINMNGGLLTGNGDVVTVDGLNVNYGTIAPGDGGIGNMNIDGNMYFNGTLEIEFDWVTYDTLNVYGDVLLTGGSTLDISFLDQYPSVVEGDYFDLIFANSFNGEFGFLNYDTALLNGLALTTDFIQVGDNQNVLRLYVISELTAVTQTAALASVSAVPLPSAVWLMMSGVLGLITVARRKREV